MALPVYPPELPNPLQGSYQFAYGDGRFRSQADTGTPNFRARYSATPDAVQVSTHLDQWRLGIFNRFLLEEVKRAANPFLIANHMMDGKVWFDEDGNPLLGDDDQPLLISDRRVAWFDQMPTVQPRGIGWVASFTLMVMP